MSIPRLESPAGTSAPEKTNPKQQSSLIWILSGIIVCLVLIIMALLLKPQQDLSVPAKTKQDGSEQVSNNSVAVENNLIRNTSKNTNNEVNNNVSEKTVNKKSFNEQTEINWILKQTESDNVQMNLWAEKEYQQARQLAQQARQAKKDQHFVMAESLYRQAVDIVTRTLQNKQQIKDDLIKNSSRFLSENRVEQAQQEAEKARIINPEDPKLVQLLESISSRPEIIILEQQAQEYEAKKKPELAIENYNKIIALDKSYVQAQDSIKRLEQEVKDNKFKKLTGQLIESLDNSDLKQARQLYEQANHIYPDDTVLLELKQRIDVLQRTRTIQHNLRSADYYQKQEQWNKALKAYKTVLSIDPNSTRALLNVQRSKKYININQSLDNIILKPERLQNEKVFQNSREIVASIKAELNRANGVLYSLSKTPQLESKLFRVDKIIKDASKIINVEIVSDNKTDVVIYKVGKLGKFENKIIDLRPGVYTIVGSREGYKDYRKKLKVGADKNNVSIMVTCKEKI